MRPSDFYALPTQISLLWHDYAVRDQVIEALKLEYNEMDWTKIEALQDSPIVLQRKVYRYMHKDTVEAYALTYFGKPCAVMLAHDDTRSIMVTDHETFTSAWNEVNSYRSKPDFKVYDADQDIPGLNYVGRWEIQNETGKVVMSQLPSPSTFRSTLTNISIHTALLNSYEEWAADHDGAVPADGDFAFMELLARNLRSEMLKSPAGIGDANLAATPSPSEEGDGAFLLTLKTYMGVQVLAMKNKEFSKGADAMFSAMTTGMLSDNPDKFQAVIADMQRVADAHRAEAYQAAQPMRP